MRIQKYLYQLGELNPSMHLAYQSWPPKKLCSYLEESILFSLCKCTYVTKHIHYLTTTFWQQILDHAIDILYSNNVPAQANHFTHHLLKQCLNRLFKQIQSVSESEIHIFSSTAVRISHGNLCHQTQSNKNRTCSENWSVCNAHILMVKA